MEQAPVESAASHHIGWNLLGFVLAASAGGLLYAILFHGPKFHTSLTFIGIPLVLAVVLALTPKAKTATGGILKGMTLALLLVAPLLGEGYLCILVAAPLFYLVAVPIGMAVDHNRRKKNQTICLAVLVLLPMSLEGTVPALTFPRTRTVEAVRVVPGTPEQIEAELGKPQRVGVRLPAFLRAGFPVPLASSGDGLKVGDTRTVHFSGAEGDPEGDLVSRVVAHRDGFVRFETQSDSSKLRQWIRWDASEIAWQAVDATHTRVTWKITFDRQLDPAWYFTPWERVAVHQAAAYLIQVNATPAGAR